MDREYVVAHNLVERYLRGELDEETRAAFEIYYLGCPQTLQELQLSDALRRGMKDVVHELDTLERPAPETSAPIPYPSRPTLRDWWAGRPAVMNALAATLAGVMVVPLAVLMVMINKNDVLSEKLVALQEVDTGTMLVTLRIKRTLEGSENQVAYDEHGDGRYFYRLEVDYPADKQYHVTVQRRDKQGETAAIFDGTVEPNKNGYLPLLVPKRKMPTGEYVFHAKAIQTGTEYTYNLTVDTVQPGSG